MTDNDRLIDDIDRTILEIIRKNARVSNVEIARKVGMAPSAILERIRKLENKGVIEGYETRLSPKALGLGLLAFVFVKAQNDRAGESKTANALVSIPEVLEVHHVAGEDCFLVKVRTADTESLGRLLREKFGKIPTITSTRSTIVLNTMKETGQLPLAPSGNGIP
ncbi:MAG TPA: Lrp/AsnC family transcriptional regulator [Gemmatimonadales bacterium]|jgi:Lrp/AsnC family leucine-responsive transcriptional regulator|nr:Lrp/AsnC family transcriptional regulator [Gemmatimonadales bacterium]